MGDRFQAGSRVGETMSLMLASAHSSSKHACKQQQSSISNSSKQQQVAATTAAAKTAAASSDGSKQQQQQQQQAATAAVTTTASSVRLASSYSDCMPRVRLGSRQHPPRNARAEEGHARVRDGPCGRQGEMLPDAYPSA